MLNSKRILLIKFVDYTCEQCRKQFNLNFLEVHRIKRGYKGGTYDNFRNLKVVCKDCHKLYHVGIK